MTGVFHRLASWGVLAVAAAAFSMGCESTPPTDPDAPFVGSGGTRVPEPGEQLAPPPQPRPAPRPAPVITGDCAPAVGPGMTRSSLAFPTGEANSSAIMLHTVMPAQVRLGTEFNYQYQVCNLTGGVLQNVVVTQDSLDNLNIVRSTPSFQRGAAGLVWNLGELGPNETRIIDVTATASSVGIAANCVSVSYNNVLCHGTEVVEPALQLTKTVSETNVLVCDPVEICYTVTNPGTGVASNVVIRDTLANGLTANGSSTVSIPVGDLDPGESETRCISVDVSAPGRYFSPASANADGGLTASAPEVGTVYTEPELAITCTSRDFEFIDRPADFTYTVRNSGNGPAENVVATVNLSGGSITGTSAGAASGSTATVQLGTIPAGQSRDFTVTGISGATGTMSASAAVTGVCADPANTSCSVDYRGIPAIALEVIDGPDPVEVGTTTVYTVTVTNQGTAVDRNIRVVAELPTQMSFVGATGDTDVTAAGQSLTFNPVASLAAGAQATWRVTVRANAAGNVRFALQMTSDEFTEPVRETEATNLYE